MCGIVGFLALDGVMLGASEFDVFTDSLSHRGPDGRGVWLDKESRIQLGHRRLAIIDTSENGIQPMSDVSRRYWITYNGEIFNFIELKKELAMLGYTFYSNTDTEVILQAYAHWGEDCQLKFNGMWAFAIWDKKLKKLFLSRDRFGVKPLHFISNERYFAFASEMKAFLKLPVYRFESNRDAISMALADYTSLETSELCLMAGVSRLIGGHCLTLNLNENEVRVRRWWNTLDHLEVESVGNDNDLIGGFRDTFLDATKIRARSDVPIATALSGGLDSSSVLAALSKVMGQSGGDRAAESWRAAFIGHFPNSVQDETRYALEMANYSGVEPHVLEINPQEAIDNIEKIVFQLEEIYDVPAALWLLYREMSRSGVKVSIDGHGGDELLAGYHHYPKIAFAEAINYSFPNATAKMMKDIYYGLHSEGVYIPPLSATQSRMDNFLQKPKGFVLGLKNKYFKNATGPSTWLLKHSPDRISPILEQDRSRIMDMDAVSRQQYIDFHITTLPTILRNFDRMSMAHGVEIRAPFMDWRLVKFAFSAPLNYKLGEGYSKLILRKAMKGYMPENIRLRRGKLGFVFPLLDWGGQKSLREFILDMASNERFLSSEVWNGMGIKKDLERAFKNKDAILIRHAWPFLQASILINQFRSNNI